MRDTGDMMEDALSEDTMMECGGDETALDDLVDLTTEISHSAPTIRDAAERLLTLLGVENDGDDFLSSSEDEGVELDEDSDDDDEEEPENTRLLHQLAASLAEELKYSQKQHSASNSTSTRLGSHQRGVKPFTEPTQERPDNQFQSMEVGQDTPYHVDTKNSKFSQNYVEQTVEYKSTIGRSFCPISNSSSNESSFSPRKFRSDTRLRLGSDEGDEEKTVFTGEATGISGSWAAGWDACAAEAIRYLVEEEGLSPNHPTVLAMKGHLEIQRERALAQYAM